MFNLIKEVDNYYKTCDDVTPTLFVDQKDLELYKEHTEIKECTEKLYKKVLSTLKYISNKNVINHLIVCYVLSIKFYTDCWISEKPYTFIINILGKTYNWLKPQKRSQLEKKILQKIDYNFD